MSFTLFCSMVIVGICFRIFYCLGSRNACHLMQSEVDQLMGELQKQIKYAQDTEMRYVRLIKKLLDSNRL